MPGDIHRIAGAALAAWLLSAPFALAQDPAEVIRASLPADDHIEHLAFAPTLAQTTSIPIGHLEFCRRLPAECRPHRDTVERIALTDQKWRELVEINAYFNAAIVPVTDMEHLGVAEDWAFPDNGYGDCEDFALAKRRELIGRGWHPSTLLMTVVRERDGAGHAVLMVRTDRGDLVLDNQDPMIRLWTETPYQFVKRQAQNNPAHWVSIDDTRSVTIVSSTNN